MRARSQPAQARWTRRLAWLCVFWFAGVSAMGLVVLLLRGLMRAAGLAG